MILEFSGGCKNLREKGKKMSKVHDLINSERKKRGIPTVYWSREMARLAQSQANHCARVGRLVHSDRFAFQGGENLAEGGENFSPRAIVDCWLHSKAGHREYLLSPRVRKAGVGIAKSKGKTYVAWAFSDQPPSYPDCPYYKRAVKGSFLPIVKRPQWNKLGAKKSFMSITKWLTKLCLNLVILTGLGFLIRYGYLLFVMHSEEALKGSIILILGFAALVAVIKLSRSTKYKRAKPSFKLTTLSVVALLLILAFAGVQPMATYKDQAVDSTSSIVEKWQEQSEIRKAEQEAEIVATETEFDKVTSELTSPELIRSYMEENFSYDLEKYQRWLAGENWHWDNPEEFFNKKVGGCGEYAGFALYCLLKNGYEYNNFGKHKSNAAAILGLQNSANLKDAHTVLLYISEGMFYTIDKDKVDEVSMKGPFNTIEDAATASLSTWTEYQLCDLYSCGPWITKTVGKGLP